MDRLKKHFMGARTCTPETRAWGLEIETLFVDKLPDTILRDPDLKGRYPHEQPIERSTSQRMFLSLVEKHGWTITGIRGGTVVQIDKIIMHAEHNHFYTLIFELGWNNIELITPACCICPEEAKFLELDRQLAALHSVAELYNGRAYLGSYDQWEHKDTLMMPDKRDEVWKELDGPVLCVLGHIASVHYNIDLCSIDEGMKWIRKIANLRKRHGWPNHEVARIWTRYLAESHAGYEPDRYGTTPARNFEEYCDKLAGYKVHMGHIGNRDPKPQRIAMPLSYRETHWVSEELFLRSVWWGARLRVRGDQLVLEIRDVPRGTDSEIRENFKILRQELGF